MADESNLDKLRALSHRLSGLLEANEAGLHTWHEAVHEAIDEIAAFSTYRPAVRDAHESLSKIPLPWAEEWVKKVERLGLVEERRRVSVSVSRASRELPGGGRT
jgi:hypothetical protein